MPTDEGPRIRQGHYVILGVAGIVIATVFAVVASLATRSPSQVQPVPDLPGPVVGDSSTTTTRPGATTTTTAAPTTTTTTATTTMVTTTTVTTTTRRTTTTTTTTTPPKPAPQAPRASFTATCNGLNCSFDGSASSDPDGTIVYWAWSFGEENRGVNGPRVPRAQYTYQQPGRHTVTLLVMDNDGKIGRATAEVNLRR